MTVAEMSSRTPGKPAGRWARFRRLLKESRTAWLYILPAGLVMLFITLISQLYQIWMSFTDYRVKNLRFIVFDLATWEKCLPIFVGLQTMGEESVDLGRVESVGRVPRTAIHVIDSSEAKTADGLPVWMP